MTLALNIRNHGFLGCAIVLVTLGSCAEQTHDRATGAAGSAGAVPSSAGSGGSSGGAPTGSGGLAISIDLGIAGVTGVGGAKASVWPPEGYVNVTDTTVGAYALGPELTNGNVTMPGACAGLFGVVRDFKRGDQTGGHPDFETAPVQDVKGMVEQTLGADGKPVYARPGGRVTGISGQATFDQWFRDTPDVNRPFILALKVVESNGVSTFSAAKDNGGDLVDSSFFPLDGQGFGDEGQAHNFNFTTEIHTAFTYSGGETFTFKGDDDVWVFIDKKLVIDLGGRHGQETGTVSVDTLGLTRGAVYDLAVFHAERHTSESNFQIQTTMAFTDCGQVNGIILL